MAANVSDKHTASFLPEVGDSCAPLEQWESVISWSLHHTHEDRRFNSQRDYVRTLSRYGEEVVAVRHVGLERVQGTGFRGTIS